MEIRYKRTYVPGGMKRYTLGEVLGMPGYALEAADPRVKLKAGKLAPGEICMLIFGVTPEEYALRESDPKALDALAEKLLKNHPADRLLAWRIVDLKGAPVQKEIEVLTGDSIDGGAYTRMMREKTAQMQAGPVDALLLESKRLQKLCADKNAPEGVKQDWLAARASLGRALMELEKLYVADDVLTGNRWPSIGFDGRAEIFTTRERAERTARQITSAHNGLQLWTIREIPGTQIDAFFGNCAENGMSALRVDNGFSATDLFLNDFRSLAPQPNAPLRGNIIREVEFGTRWQKLKEMNAPEPLQRGALESTLSMRNFAWRELGNAKMYVLCAGGRRENAVLLGSREPQDKYLGVFSSRMQALAFAERIEIEASPVEMDFDEAAQRSMICKGLIVDAGPIGYRLEKAQYDTVRDLRTKPLMVVRLQPKEAEEKKPEAAPAAQPELGSLPNPDAFDLPPREEAPAPEAPALEKPADEAPKKGFFRRLFGKS